MRDWTLTAHDPMAPMIAADARCGRTTYADDQVWRLRLGQPDEPAITLETRYGGRVGLARLVPMWVAGRRQVYESQGYHAPPILTAFAPDYLRLRAELTIAIKLTYEFWTMESQAVGGRCTVQNTSDHPQDLRFDLSVQAVREEKSLQMFFLTLEGGQTALQLGRLPNLQPVLLLEGADPGSTTQARLTRGLTLAPGQQIVIRWVLGSQQARDASLMLAHKWIMADWDPHLAYINRLAEAQPEVETGDPALDLALAWSQHIVLGSFLAATGQLSHPSFVESRKINQGYAVSGTHSGGFGYPWGGQTVPDALSLIATPALAAPELAKGVVRNFLAVQREDGWIDARPGLDGQRAHVLAPPMLATLAHTVYAFTGDKLFLADCLNGLVAFFHRWFKPDVDADRDGVPEWSQAGQGAFMDGPTLAQGKRWAQGADLTTLEAPDLLAYLVREAGTLVKIAEILGRDDVAAEMRLEYDRLRALLGEFWDGERGVFFYRDRDSHARPAGEIVFQGKGDQTITEAIDLVSPSRLILRVLGGLSKKPNLDCTVEGINAEGKPANETVPAASFDWYRGMGSATTKTVWKTIKYLKFSGLSRVFKIEVATLDLTRHDQALLVPLWSGALDDDQIARTVALMTDPAHYWREYGISGSPASDPAYDPSLQNGNGGLWPAWNARFGLALIETGHAAESVELFKRLLAAQTRCLREEGTFRALINPDTGEGMGDSGTVTGAVSWHWFAALFGAFVIEPGFVGITGPFHFAGESMRWTQHGVVIARSEKGTTITFPTGTEITLPPDAEPQIVNDPKAKRHKPEPIAPPPDPQESVPTAPSPGPGLDDVSAETGDPFAGQDDGLMPDGE